MDKINHCINHNRFIPIDAEELTALELIGKGTEKTNELVDKSNDHEERIINNEKKKVSFDDMKEKYKFDNNFSDIDYRGKWFGLDEPTLSDEGMRSQVQKNREDVVLVKEKHETDINNVNSQLESIVANEIPKSLTNNHITDYDMFMDSINKSNDLLNLTEMLDFPVITTSTTTKITNGVKKFTWNGGTNAMETWFSCYEYPKVAQVGTSYPNNFFIKNTAMTGANLSPMITVEFMYDGSEIEIQARSMDVMVIWIDEGRGFERLTKKNIDLSGCGSLGFVNLKFLEAKKRILKISVKDRFGGCTIQPNTNVTVSTKSSSKKKIAWVGDSFTEGAGSVEATRCFAQQVSQKLNMKCINNGIGATGYIANASGSRTDFITRIQNDVLDLTPDFIVLAGGINDSSVASKEQIRVAVDTLIKKIKTDLPSAQLIVLSSFSPRNIWQALVDTNEAIKTACLSNSVAYIDTCNGQTYSSNGTLITKYKPWFSGTNINTKDGNCWMYISSDTTHPKQTGHNYIANLLYIEINKIININEF